MTAHHLAQLNIATPLYPLDDPRMAGFTDNLDAINALAEAAPGFVWRLVGDGNDATDILWPSDTGMLVNMSVWTDADALFDFVYKTAHTKVMAGRRAWFERTTGAFQVLWWVPVGHTPTLAEAADRLAALDRDGPSPAAFTLKQRYPAPQPAPVP